jgi:hypothetical protein
VVLVVPLDGKRDVVVLGDMKTNAWMTDTRVPRK